MNQNLPDDRQDADYDPTLVSDYVWDYACSIFNTDNPTEEQLDECFDELFQKWESQENRGGNL